MRPDRSVILSNSLRLLLPTAFLFSLYLLFAGHNAPGGGFIGGLVAGAALVLRHVDQGPEAVAELLPVEPRTILSAGLGLAVLTAMAPWVTGDQLLESAKLEIDLPVLETVKATSALVFDIGVFLVVVGLATAILRILGERPGE
ncbi:MAG: MnhB domain-containing protein [Actinomycetota bacterium]